MRSRSKLPSLLIPIALLACSDESQPAPQPELPAAAVPAPATDSKYLGLEHELSVAAIAIGAIELPDSLAVESVMFLDNPAYTGAGPHNALTRVVGPRGQMVWLEEMVDRVEGAGSRWRVAGVLELPPIEETQAVVVSKDCRTGSRHDPNIVAITNRAATEGPWYTQIVHAWRANLPTRSFDRIATADLRCPIS